MQNIITCPSEDQLPYTGPPLSELHRIFLCDALKATSHIHSFILKCPLTVALLHLGTAYREFEFIKALGRSILSHYSFIGSNCQEFSLHCVQVEPA